MHIPASAVFSLYDHQTATQQHVLHHVILQAPVQQKSYAAVDTSHRRRVCRPDGSSAERVLHVVQAQLHHLVAATAHCTQAQAAPQPC